MGFGVRSPDCGFHYQSPESMTSGSFTRHPALSGSAWTATSMVPTISKILDLSEEGKAAERLRQAKDNEFHDLVEGNLVLKSGLLEKKRHAHYPTRWIPGSGG
jgi:hypothetical protein